MFSKNRDRLIDHDVAKAFLAEVVGIAERGDLLSNEHFSVDGTLLKAWASQKSFQPKDGPPPEGSAGLKNAQADFKGERRSNDTHASTTDPDARLYRKSANTGAELSYLGHVLMDHRNGLVRDVRLTEANGRAEREAAKSMLSQLPGAHRKTVAADKAYDTAEFVTGCRQLGVTPHVAQNRSNRRSAIDGRTTRHAGYRKSLSIRAWIETHFGWLKAAAGVRQVKQRGRAQVEALFWLAMATSNLVRMRRLLSAEAR